MSNIIPALIGHTCKITLSTSTAQIPVIILKLNDNDSVDIKRLNNNPTNAVETIELKDIIKIDFLK